MEITTKPISSTKKYNKITFLPYSEDKDFNEEKKKTYAYSTVNIKKLLKISNIETELENNNYEDIRFLDNHSIDWLGPTILFPLAVISQNPEVVNITLNIISSYVYDLFKGKEKDPKVDCTFVYEDKKEMKKITYKGPISGLNEIKEIINRE